jgi:hypothetical protein
MSQAESTLITSRRNFLVRASALTVAGATVAIPIITVADARARMQHHADQLVASGPGLLTMPGSMYRSSGTGTPPTISAAAMASRPCGELRPARLPTRPMFLPSQPVPAGNGGGQMRIRVRDHDRSPALAPGLFFLVRDTAAVGRIEAPRWRRVASGSFGPM